MKRPRLGIDGRNVTIGFNLGPLVGERGSLVGFTHRMSPKRARELAGALATLALAAENACRGTGSCPPTAAPSKGTPT